MVVDDDELLRLGQRAGTHLESRKAADRDGAVERPFHVLGGDRRAVLECRLTLELEGGRHVADAHVIGQFHLELVAVVIGRAVDRLHLVTDQAVVAVPRDLIARNVGAHAMNVDVVRPAFGDDQQCLLARLRLRGRPDRWGRDGAACGKRCHRFEKVTALHGGLPGFLTAGLKSPSANSVPALELTPSDS